MDYSFQAQPKGGRHDGVREPVREVPPREGRRVPAEAIGLGLNVVAAAFLFGFLGQWVGKRVGAEEALTLIGGLVGAGAGFYSLYLHLAGRPRQDHEKKPE
ncbi:MAG: AtpZ/AtpI family protein [Gemmatimonadetes bacterium]|nr:AtpZ/AtpI family protein [Gemmatimonadota bacterium]